MRTNPEADAFLQGMVISTPSLINGNDNNLGLVLIAFSQN